MTFESVDDLRTFCKTHNCHILVRVEDIPHRIFEAYPGGRVINWHEDQRKTRLLKQKLTPPDPLVMVAFRIPTSLRDALIATAKQNDRPYVRELRRAIQDHIERQAKTA